VGVVKHLSVRIPWHDRGWDGFICYDPKKNKFCTGIFSVNANPIRQKRTELGKEWEEESKDLRKRMQMTEHKLTELENMIKEALAD